MTSERPEPRSSTPAFRKPWPTVFPTACSAVLLLLTGCGGSDQPKQAAAPKLPADVGTALADDAAAVADALDAGDEAGAKAAAETLVADVDAAIEAGAVPEALRADLVAGVARLMVALPEVQPPPPPKKPGKGQGKKKKHDENDEGDEE